MDNPLKKKSQGLGDTVEKVAYIASLGRFNARGNRPEAGKKKQKDCGCGKRKEALNKKASYNKED
jgi:hypothetical protein